MSKTIFERQRDVRRIAAMEEKLAVLRAADMPPIHPQERTISLGAVGMRESESVFNVSTGEIEPVEPPARAAEAAPDESALPTMSGMQARAQTEADALIAEQARVIRLAKYGPAAEAIRSRQAQEHAEANPGDPHISSAADEQAAARARRRAAAQREEAFLASAPWNENGIPDVERVNAFYGQCPDYLYTRIALKAKAAMSREPTALSGDGSYVFVF